MNLFTKTDKVESRGIVRQLTQGKNEANLKLENVLKRIIPIEKFEPIKK